MRVLDVRNVGVAWSLLPQLMGEAREATSRAGPVLVMDTPVTTVYRQPVERVLLDPARDANPFFHVMEALWMLAGREDAALLNRYVSDFGARFAEETGYVHGAYGYRWRTAMGFDQLDAVVKKLRENPSDRQCVIQMWDGHLAHDAPAFPNGATGADDLEGSWRDRPCNTHAYLRLRELEEQRLLGTATTVKLGPYLDMTVCCRSNDAVWGAYGANAVHFSFLLEYLAARIGVKVGVYYQVSNNFHVYRDVWDKMVGRISSTVDEYPATRALVDDPATFDADLRRFLDWHDAPPGTSARQSSAPPLSNSWLTDVAGNMVRAHRYWRAGEREAALGAACMIGAADWRVAATDWMMRRLERRG